MAAKRCTCNDYVRAPCEIHEPELVDPAVAELRGRVEESRALRAAKAAGASEVWAMAERLSRGGHSAPRMATSIYNELMAAYELGKRHATDVP